MNLGKTRENHMINKKKLIQFYVEQYEREGKRKPKKPPK